MTVPAPVTVAAPRQMDGAVYGVVVNQDALTLTVELPAPLNLSPEAEALVVAQLNNAAVVILAPHWAGRSRTGGSCGTQ